MQAYKLKNYTTQECFGESISWVNLMSRGGAGLAFDVFYNFETVFLILSEGRYLDVKFEIVFASCQVFLVSFLPFWFIPEQPWLDKSQFVVATQIN
jgi:hypothetical protein